MIAINEGKHLSSTYGLDNYLGGLNSTVFPWGHGAYQIADSAKCFNEIIKYENKTKDVSYKYIVLGRTDLMWMGEHLPINQKNHTTLNETCWIPCESNDWGGLCDHWQFCTRAAAKQLSQNAYDYIVGPGEYTGAMNDGKRVREKFLKNILERNKVAVKRFTAPFFRSCQNPPERGHKCQYVPLLNMYGKQDGKAQLTPFVEKDYNKMKYP